MPKAKCFDRRSRTKIRSLLLATLWLASAAVHAQTPSLLDMVESAKQSKQLEHNKALIDAYKSSPANVPEPPKAGAVPTPPQPPAVIAAPPVLRAIYGVNHLIEAEVVFDGQSYSLYSDDARVEIGPWTYGVVFREGVLLLRKPLDAKQSSQLDSLADQGLERLISCKRLGLVPAQCLFLPASKASTGVLPMRTSSALPGALPPLPR